MGAQNSTVAGAPTPNRSVASSDAFHNDAQNSVRNPVSKRLVKSSIGQIDRAGVNNTTTAMSQNHDTVSLSKIFDSYL